MAKVTAISEPIFSVRLTEKEMQCIANGLSNYFRWASIKGVTHAPGFIVTLQGAMEKMKKACENPSIHLLSE